MRHLAILLMVVVGCWSQQDETIVPQTFGNSVVEASIQKIRFTCIFPDDRQFVRRMAYVETNDGQVADTYPPDYDGGIWQIDEDMYDQTKTSNNGHTQQYINAIAAEASLYNIDWRSTTWEDLRKPLYSAIATYLYMFDQAPTNENIPVDVDGQADFWTDYIRPGENRQDFIDASNTLQENCETAGGADIVFVLDSSGSIGAANFQLIKDFVIQVVQSFDVSPRKYQFGVQQYSAGSWIEFVLNSYDNQQDVVDAVERIDYLTGGTNTYLALDDLVDISFQPGNGARGPGSGFQQIAFVMTDGESSNEQATIEAALRVHDALITTYAISIGSSIRESELIAIASDPDCIHYYALENADEFAAIIESIKKSTCDAPLIFGGGDGAENDTTVGEFLPGEGLNCQVFLPENGTTCKISPELGPVNFYVASDTYPSPSYYEGLEEALPQETGVLFLPTNVAGLIYCHILNNGTLPDNVTIGCFPGDQDNCANENVVCENGGSCNDLFGDGWSCSCPDGFEGERCEVSTATTTTTSAPTTTVTVDPDYCEYCYDGPCDCEGVYAPNPCPPCAGDDQGDCFPGNLRPHYVFADGTNENRFCQCDGVGLCFEFDCQPGLIYLECINSCAFPGTQCP